MYRLLLIALLLLQPLAALADNPADKERAFQDTGLVDPSANIKDKVRVAILPFDTPKDQPDIEQYGAGTMDSMIDGLKAVPKFIMLDRGRIDRIIKEQAFAQTGLVDAKTAVPIGKILQAQTLVSGSLQSAGTGDSREVMVVANFVDVKTGEIQDTQKVKGQLKNIFDLQEQLVGLFVKNQKVEVTPVQQQRIDKVVKSTTSLTAYDYYLKGRKAYLKFTPDGYKEANSWYQKAIDTDANYALAYTGLGETWMFWGFQKQVNGEPYQHEYQQAFELSQKALALNPDLAEAHRVYAEAARFLGKPQAEYVSEARKAMELNPNDAENWYQLWYATGHFNDPDHEYIKKAIALNGDLLMAHASRAWQLYLVKRYDEAAGEYKEALRINPDFAWVHGNLGLNLAAQKQWTDAIAQYKEAIRLDPNFAWPHFNLSTAYWTTGHLPETVHELEETLRIDPKNEQALKWLPQAKAALQAGH